MFSLPKPIKDTADDEGYQSLPVSAEYTQHWLNTSLAQPASLRSESIARRSSGIRRRRPLSRRRARLSPSREKMIRRKFYRRNRRDNDDDDDAEKRSEKQVVVEKRKAVATNSAADDEKKQPQSSPPSYIINTNVTCKSEATTKEKDDKNVTDEKDNDDDDDDDNDELTETAKNVIRAAMGGRVEKRRRLPRRCGWLRTISAPFRRSDTWLAMALVSYIGVYPPDGLMSSLSALTSQLYDMLPNPAWPVTMWRVSSALWRILPVSQHQQRTNVSEFGNEAIYRAVSQRLSFPAAHFSS